MNLFKIFEKILLSHDIGPLIRINSFALHAFSYISVFAFSFVKCFKSLNQNRSFCLPKQCHIGNKSYDNKHAFSTFFSMHELTLNISDDTVV